MANIPFPSIAPPPPAVTRILTRYSRSQIEAFIEVALALLDTIDGDADLEDATDLEDDFALTRYATENDGPGCNISDPDFGVDDEGEGIDEREQDWGDYDNPIPISGGGSGDC